jgi:hypothetical protein
MGLGYSGIRRGAAIAAYVGPNGGGKTLAMVHDTLPDLDLGTKVLSTVQLLDVRSAGAAGGPEPHPLCEMLRTWTQLLEAENCVILLDEVTGVASSRQYAALPAQLQNILVQLRKRNVVLRWSSPNYARADVIMREVTQTVTVCKGYLAKADPVSQWPQRRLFRWRTYDAIDYEDFAMAKAEQVKPMCSSWFHRTPKKAAPLAYNTKDAVSTLDHMDLAGLCVTCNGKKIQPKCTCPTETPQVSPRQAQLVGEREPTELVGIIDLIPAIALPIMDEAPPKGGLG